MEQKRCSWQTTKKKITRNRWRRKTRKNKRYEEHWPERKLNTKWQEGWPWLQFNLEENSMTCSICMDYYQGKEMPINTVKGQNRFLSGCTNRKISAVTDHEKGCLYLKAVEVLIKKMDKEDNWREVFLLSREC